MPKVIVTAQVDDPVKWEAGFRTHGELFRGYSIAAPIHFSIEGNEVAICMEPEDVDAYKRSVDSPATVAAMELDGVRRETVKFYFLDKEMTL